MRYGVFVCLIFAFACKQQVGGDKTKTPPLSLISTQDTALHNQNGTWIYKKEKFNGYILEKKQNHLIAKVPIVEGKENGIAYGWFESGVKRYERSFVDGNRHGIHKIWYQNGVLAGINFYQNDKLEGEQRSYFENGKIWQSLHYRNGYEEGKQKSWNDSGRVINNFTVKNGKLYGVIGRFDCMSVQKK